MIRHQSQTDIEVHGQPELLRRWHTDYCRRGQDSWQVVWSQATTIEPSGTVPPHDPLVGAQNDPLWRVIMPES